MVSRSLATLLVITVQSGAITSLVGAPATLFATPPTYTHNSAGNVTISWPAGTLPAAPSAIVSILGAVGAHSYAISLTTGTNSVNVFSVVDAVATDLDFVLMVL